MNTTEFLFDEPSSPPITAKNEQESLGPRHLSGSQAAALGRLADLAGLRGQEDCGGVRVRNKALIVGRSGVGKTAVVRRLCDVEELPLLVINTGSWIVHGAATMPHTVSVIRQFVEIHEAGCIFLDELDKACPHGQTFVSNWALGTLTEIISVLDADAKLGTSGWRPEHIRRLSDAYFVVGAGAWQAHARAEKESANEGGYTDRIRRDAGIPDELLLRFHPSLVAIAPPTTKDLALAVRRIRLGLSLPALPEGDEQKLAIEGAASGFGMRWIEAYLSQLLIQHPRKRMKPHATAKPENKVLTMTRQEFTQRLAGMTELLDMTRRPTKELEVKLRLALVIAVQSSPEQRKNFVEPKEISSLLEEIQGFLPGLAFVVSTTGQERARRETQLHVHGHCLVRGLDRWFQDKPFALKSLGLLDLAVQVYASVQRILDACKYLGNVEVRD